MSSELMTDNYLRPGVINNSDLLDKYGNFKQDLVEGLDFVLLKEKAYLRLKRWYGVEKEIKKKIVKI